MDRHGASVLWGVSRLYWFGGSWPKRLGHQLHHSDPLYTQIRDIFNMAHIIAIPRFSGAEGQEWEREVNKRITKEKRANTKVDKEATSERTLV